jgi:hypothetical protein
MYAEKFLPVSGGGAEQRVKRVQTREQGPPSSPKEIGNCNYIHDPNQSHSMRKVRSFIPYGTILQKRHIGNAVL